MALTRSRTVRLLVRELEASGPVPDGVRAQRIAPAVQSEVALQDDERRLRGRLDRLERDAGGLTIVDLKSGVSQGGVTDSQRRQLLLYAVLVHRCLDEWATAAAIESASGVRSSIAIVPAEAEAVAADAERRLSTYNEAIRSGANSLERLADPSIDTCRWCPVRVACEPYWENLTSEWPYQGAVLGAVTEVGTSAAGQPARITAESPADRQGKTVSAFGVWPWVVAISESVAIVGAHEVGSTGVLRIGRDTVIGHRDSSGGFVA